MLILKSNCEIIYLFVKRYDLIFFIVQDGSIIQKPCPFLIFTRKNYLSFEQTINLMFQKNQTFLQNLSLRSSYFDGIIF